MVRVRREPRVPNLPNPRMHLEALGERLSRGVLLFDAERQSLDASVNEIRSVWIEAGAEDATKVANQGHQPGLARYDAAEDVIVPC